MRGYEPESPALIHGDVPGPEAFTLPLSASPPARTRIRPASDATDTCTGHAAPAASKRWDDDGSPSRSRVAPHSDYCIPANERLWCDMVVGGPLCPRAARLRPALSLLMLVLGIASVPNVGLSALHRSHCTRHAGALINGGHVVASPHTVPGDESATWTKAASHDCAHCPASECARTAPCTSASMTALTPVGVDVIDLQAIRLPGRFVRDSAPSASYPPDTPPPQLIA